MEKRANRPRSTFESFIKDEYKLWKRQKEGNYIRILPAAPGEHWAIEVYVHYEVGPGKGAVLCNFKMNKGPCPICEEKARLERRMARKEEIDSHRVAKCFLAWVQDMRNQEEMQKGPQVARMSDSLERDIVLQSRDRRTGKWYFVDNPTEGYNVGFDIVGEKKQQKHAGLVLDRQPSAISREIWEEVTEHPISSVLQWRSYDEVKELMLGKTTDEPENSREPERSRESERIKEVSTPAQPELPVEGSKGDRVRLNEDESLRKDREAIKEMTGDDLSSGMTETQRKVAALKESFKKRSQGE
jgi:hypothetical protein